MTTLLMKRISKNSQFLNADIRNKKILKKYLKWADVVVWMAALVGDGLFSKLLQITFDINSRSVKFLAKNLKNYFFLYLLILESKDGLIDELLN